jgi:Ser/Thr protein kinase RdoA (MazF antagonist)
VSVSSDSSFLEIVEQDEGEFVLKRMDDEEALVTIQFSEEVIEYLREHQVDVAKAMIGAGVQTASAKTRAAYEARQEEEIPSTVH